MISAPSVQAIQHRNAVMQNLHDLDQYVKGGGGGLSASLPNFRHHHHQNAFGRSAVTPVDLAATAGGVFATGSVGGGDGGTALEKAARMHRNGTGECTYVNSTTYNKRMQKCALCLELRAKNKTFI